VIGHELGECCSVLALEEAEHDVLLALRPNGSRRHGSFGDRDFLRGPVLQRACPACCSWLTPTVEAASSAIQRTQLDIKEAATMTNAHASQVGKGTDRLSRLREDLCHDMASYEKTVTAKMI
jgi:hypothetical protein